MIIRKIETFLENNCFTRATVDTFDEFEKIDPCKPEDVNVLADYDFRVYLPVPNNSFDIDRKWRTVRGEIKKLRERIKTQEKDLRELRDACKKFPFPQVRKVCLDELAKKFGRRISQTKATLSRKKSALARIEKLYPDALRQQVVEHWIESASNFRCVNDMFGCLLNEQIDKYGERIPVGRN